MIDRQTPPSQALPRDLLAVIVPVKSLGVAELDRLVTLASRAPDLQVIAVGSVAVDVSQAPSNLHCLDVACKIYAAMNIGAEHARATYLLFMGIDDELLADNVPPVVAGLVAVHAALVVLPFCVGSRLVNQRPAQRPRSFHHQGVLFRRDALLAAGGYSDQYRLHSDLDLMLRMQRTATPVALALPLVRFSKGGMSTSGRHALDSIREFFAIFARQGVSRLTPSFLFSIALLMLYRVRFLLSRSHDSVESRS
jgi:hypothetical protein